MHNFFSLQGTDSTTARPFHTNAANPLRLSESDSFCRIFLNDDERPSDNSYGCLRLILSVEKLGHFYFLYPILFVLIVTLILLLLPRTIDIHEKAKLLLFEWGKLAGNNKYLKKKLKAIRPFRYYAGVNSYYFYYTDKSLLTTYLLSVVDSTTSMLITFN